MLNQPRFVRLGLLTACLAWASASHAQTPPSASDQITTLAGTSACAKTNWKQRGRAPVAYIKGMALAYAKAYCELKTTPGSAAAAIAGTDFKPPSDALVLYGKAGGTPVERLRATYALAIGEGMRESSGNTTVGYDSTVKKQTAEIAEAGLFQVSHDAIGLSPWLPKLYAQYQGDTASCGLDVFMQGVKDHKAKVIGTGPGADFQQFTKACPVFAVESAAVLFRTKLQHFGPIKRKEAELLPACEALLQEVEAKAVCP